MRGRFKSTMFRRVQRPFTIKRVKRRYKKEFFSKRKDTWYSARKNIFGRIVYDKAKLRWNIFDMMYTGGGVFNSYRGGRIANFFYKRGYLKNAERRAIIRDMNENDWLDDSEQWNRDF